MGNEKITNLIQSIADIRNNIKGNDMEAVNASLDYMRYNIDYLNGYIDGLLWRLENNE